MKHLGVMIFLVAVVSSCTFNGTFHGLTSYYETEKKLNPDLFVPAPKNESFCENLSDYKGKVLIVNGLQLRECLPEGKSMVYVWGAKCHGAACISLNATQDIADSLGIELFVVAEYYHAELMDLNHNINKPIFGIDTEHYKTNFTNKYTSRFLNDLFQENLEEEGYGRFILIDKKVFRGRYSYVEDLAAEIS